MKKKFLGLICFIYSLIIVYVWLTGKLGSYLAPNMQLYIKGSVIPFIIMGFVLVTNNKINYKFKVTDLVLILPLVLIIFAGDGNLTMDIAKVKATSKNRTKIEEADIVEVDPDDKKDVIPSGDIIDDPKDDVPTDTNNKIEDFYFEITDSNYSFLADYLTYIAGARKYTGKTIKAVGFAADYSEYLTSDYVAIGRYMITCCAADAEFTGFMVKYSPDKLEYGKWYEFEGYLEQGKDSEGYDIMTVNPVSVKEIDGKDINQYVYSCETYGSGACEEFQKYDLEY